MKRPMPTSLRWLIHVIGAIISLSIIILWMALVADASYRFWLLYFPAGCVMMTILGCCLGWGIHSIFDEEKIFIRHRTRAFVISWLIFSSVMCAVALALSRILAREAGLISELTKDGFWHYAVIARWIVWCLFFVLAYPYCGFVIYRKEKSHP